jgi:thiamine kinase-like enzyme
VGEAESWQVAGMPPRPPTATSSLSAARVADSLSLARLNPVPGGLTGHTFRARLGGDAVLVKVPTPARGAVTGRQERDGVVWASEQGLALPPVHFEPATGLLVLPWIAGRASTGDAAPQTLYRVGRLLRALHAGPAVATTLDPCASTRAVAARLCLDRRLAPVLGPLLAMLEELADLAARNAAPPRPCHTDFHGGNIVDDGVRLWPIDWASLAMADPLWDLAYFARCGHLGARGERLLLEAYDGRVTPRALARLQLWGAVADACLHVWCLDHLHAGGVANAFTRSVGVFEARHRAATTPERMATLRRALDKCVWFRWRPSLRWAAPAPDTLNSQPRSGR